MTNSAEIVQPQISLEALLVINEHVTEATSDIAELYKAQNLLLEPQEIIFIYCQWLRFIVSEKISGNQNHILKLISDTVQDNIEQGGHLCRIIQLHANETAVQADKLVEKYGLIVVPVLRLMRFISETIQKMLPNSKPTKKLRNQEFLNEPLQAIFEKTFQSTVLKINDLQTPNPLIFLLENFSNIIGWLAGFFAQLSNKKPQLFLEKALRILQVSE